MTGEAKKILVVEDDGGTAKFLSTVLTDAGFDVSIAVMAVEALNKIESEAPDLIVSDIGMPGASGVTLLQHLRSQPATKDLPVLVYTGSNDDGAFGSVAGIPRTSLLQKPAGPKAIVDAVLRLLS